MEQTTECIFCKIVAGTIPSRTVYEDDRFLAFLDIRPLNKGHVQVIPKTHYNVVYDVPYFGDYFEVAKRVGLAQKEQLGAFHFSLVTLGFEVPHAHIWVIPRYENDGHGGAIDWHAVQEFSPEEMDDVAKQLATALTMHKE